MHRDYDKTILEHYQKVASEHGLSATSTMEDTRTRYLETQAIITFVQESLRSLAHAECRQRATIMDVGCGNGGTLEELSGTYPTMTFVGIEYSDDLYSLASSRFAGQDNVQILKGDIRNPGFSGDVTADIMICQRVLINLLDYTDQRLALQNLIDVLAPPTKDRRGGTVLFIESFSSPLQRLNNARAEFDLSPISEAHHNLYLPDEFFDTPRLKRFHADGVIPPENFLSTHYFVTRVLHEMFTGDRPFKRNSEFVSFFSEALRPHVGDYSPLKLRVCERVE